MTLDGNSFNYFPKNQLNKLSALLIINTDLAADRCKRQQPFA